jgi:polar amino acid transport system substrate-binding protein
MAPVRRSMLAVLLVAFFATALAQAAPLRLCYEDVPQPPWTMPDGTGLNFALLAQVEKLTGEQFALFARPWTRCLQEIKGGLMDGLIGAADTPERRAFVLPPLQADGQANVAAALYTDQALVFTRAGSNASWNGKELVTARRDVVAQRGYMVASVLRQQGMHVIDSVKSAEDGLRLVVAGGADTAVLQGDIAIALARRDPRFKGKVVEAKEPYMTSAYYLVFNRALALREPGRIEAIWQAIASTRSTPDYQKRESEQLRAGAPAL